ncbi:CDP-alcohol phosphatidyltransferase family protein [Pseudoxanthomonas kaohsiungensis]|uniref:CDP-alcohol phosphatidyltransferase family protein n=1 Tax=Pseudoxanthomonas kaohsiungensis TaxID=283923 RepID=UPI0035B1DFDF
MSQDDDRRPLASRDTGWARRIAAALARSSITPNQISVASVAFAGAGAAALLLLAAPAGPLLAALGIQLRLLCNLFDGMVAIEGGKQTAAGALYNEFPDRIADSLLIVALGYAAGLPWLGWCGALLAALTAYVRQTGAGLGLGHDFRGPMAKQHRMFVMTAGCLVAAAAPIWASASQALALAAVVIAAGSLLTCLTRSRAIARRLRAGGPAR